MQKFVLLLAVGLLTLAACLPYPAALPPTPTVKPYPALAEPILPSGVTAAAGLTPTLLANAEYTTRVSPDVAQTYRLRDGLYQQGVDPALPDYVRVVLLDKVATGDLNADGLDDAAVLLSENYGGTGVFVSLIAVLNQAGEPRQAAVTAVDDRPMIEAVDILDGRIVLRAVLHSLNDPGCCPTFSVARTYLLSEDELVLVRQTSRTPNGRERIVTISSPLSEAQVSGAVELRGDVTIAPFENNLVYRLYDKESNLLAEGPVAVSAPDLGAPGTFEALIPLTDVPLGEPVRLEVIDVSMADGSVLAMDSVYVVVR